MTSNRIIMFLANGYPFEGRKYRAIMLKHCLLGLNWHTWKGCNSAWHLSSLPDLYGWWSTSVFVFTTVKGYDCLWPPSFPHWGFIPMTKMISEVPLLLGLSSISFSPICSLGFFPSIKDWEWRRIFSLESWLVLWEIFSAMILVIKDDDLTQTLSFSCLNSILKC